MIYRPLLLLFLLVLTVMPVRSAVAAPPSPPQPPASGIAAIWSQVIGHQAGAQPADAFAPPSVEVRFILAGNGRTCGEYDIWYRSTAAGTWLKNNEQASERTKDIGAFQVSETDFPMTLCRQAMAADWFEAGLSEKGAGFRPVTVWSPVGKTVTSTVAGGASVGRRNGRVDQIVMVTLGDTGCRGMPPGSHGRTFQNCATDWTFPDLMDNALSVTLDNGEKAEPDLFVHVGDYRYFWENTSPDTMGYWLKDFLTPAQQALAVAPWALSRGNHETCPASGRHWFGKGWYYLFGDVDWPAQPCANLVPTTYFDIGPDGGQDPQTRHRVVMIDNSNPDNPGPGGKSLRGLFKDAVRVTLKGRDAYVASTHWVSHIPGIVYMDYCKGQCGGENGQVLRDVYEAFGPIDPCRDRGAGTPPCVPSTQLHGHQHFFQRVRLFVDPGNTATSTAPWAWPQTYIVGHGGTKADSFSFTPDRCAAGINVPYTDPAEALSGNVWAEKQHGFVAWRRAKDTVSDSAGWAATHYWFTPLMASAGDSALPNCVLK